MASRNHANLFNMKIPPDSKTQGAGLSRLLTKEHLRQSGLVPPDQIPPGPLADTAVKAVLKSSASSKEVGITSAVAKKLAGKGV